jgi:methylmalonyl-CoA mutase cobalamin-binding domain/chain
MAIEGACQAVISGDAQAAELAVRSAVEAGLDPQVILDEGLIKGAEVVGKKFESGEYFLADLMLAGNALKAAMDILRPQLRQRSDGYHGRGKVLIATVETDIHDIGKNIVSSMLVATGFEVLDLGVDVPAGRILESAKENRPDVIALSCLLTTSRPYLQDVIRLFEATGERHNHKMIVGGGAVDAAYASRIGSDGYGQNVAAAIELVRQLIAGGRGGDHRA